MFILVIFEKFYSANSTKYFFTIKRPLHGRYKSLFFILYIYYTIVNGSDCVPVPDKVIFEVKYTVGRTKQVEANTAFAKL